MAPLGATLLTLCYFAAGSMLGYIVRECVLGRANGLLDDPLPFWFGVLGNLIGTPCLWLLWRGRNRSEKLELWRDRLSVPKLAMTGLPATRRILFLCGIVAGIGGLILGLSVDAVIK